MSATSSPIPSARQYLVQPLTLGDPDVAGPLAVFPVFAAAPELKYRSFAQVLALGASVKELPGGASVNDLLVINPTDMPVLLYEGEEVLGAQQNRTFDVSVLVAAGATLQVPVSCVERDRWDGSRHGESFAPAPQAAYPELRRMKNRAASASLAAGHQARAAQGEVWSEVARKSARMNVHSQTAAMHDIYHDHGAELERSSSAVRLRDGQVGALAAIAGQPVVLDFVSRSEVFAALHAPLVRGYALDALECDPTIAGMPASPERAGAFLGSVLAARVTEHDGIGLGRDIRFGEAQVSGAGLVAGDELVQLTAFGDNGPGPGGHAPARSSRIRRPSRRRNP